MGSEGDDVQLGVRGRVTAGEFADRWVVVDVAGTTPVDPLVVVTSVDLDQPGHETESVRWVNPEDLESLLVAWSIEWTDIADDATGSRFGP